MASPWMPSDNVAQIFRRNKDENLIGVLKKNNWTMMS